MAEERREGMNQVITDIALIKQKASFIEEKLNQIVSDVENIKRSLDTKELVGIKDFDNHIIQDRWMFGVLCTLLVCIFAKVIHG